MSARVEVRDLRIGRLRRELQYLADHVVTLGWQGPSGAKLHEEAGIPVAQLAAVHEYGAGQTPARPMLRVAMERRGEELRAKLKRLTSDLIDGRIESAEAALEDLGQAGAAAVVRTIDDARGWAQPLARSTVRAKGHDQPLVESFELRESVTYAVRSGNADGPIVAQGGPEGAG